MKKYYYSFFLLVLITLLLFAGCSAQNPFSYKLTRSSDTTQISESAYVLKVYGVFTVEDMGQPYYYRLQLIKDGYIEEDIRGELNNNQGTDYSEPVYDDQYYILNVNNEGEDYRCNVRLSFIMGAGKSVYITWGQYFDVKGRSSPRQEGTFVNGSNLSVDLQILVNKK